MRSQQSDGFTLIEIVLVIALISLVAGVGLRLPFLFEPMRLADADVFVARAALYRAEMMAASGKSDGPWGVALSGESVTVFRGSSYSQREETLDVVTTLEAHPDIIGTGEVVFEQMTGAPTTPASFSMQFSSQTAAVSVNAFGVIDVAISH